MKLPELLAADRAAIHHVVESRRASNPRVLDCNTQGRDEGGVDLEILVDPSPSASPIDIIWIRVTLTELLGVPVVIVTPNALPVRGRAEILENAKPI